MKLSDCQARYSSLKADILKYKFLISVIMQCIQGRKSWLQLNFVDLNEYETCMIY